MPKVLVPEIVNFTTRFYYNKISFKTWTRLLDEFIEKDSKINYSNRCFKIRNVSEKTVIEITEKCISFFPTLDENQSEIYRKRVYKHVANRSEIYNLTSEENKQFAILSLLKDDLRACASLLYYSAHKYLTGQMYVFLTLGLGQ